MLQVDEEIREFLIESNENLACLDREIVELEQRPGDVKLISSVFRTIHTIKGTCGFFGFEILGAVTHVTENILGQAREKQRDLTPELISLILEAVDSVKSVLLHIEQTGEEGEDKTHELRVRLDAAFQAGLPGHQHKPASLPKSEPTLQPTQPAQTVQAQAPLPSEPKAQVPVLLHKVKQDVADNHDDESITSRSIAAEQELHVDAAGSEDETSNESAKEAHVVDSTIRVDVGLLNKLMNLVGELVLARNQLLQDTSTESSSLQQTSQRLNLITSELQEGVMKTRMQSVGSVWNKLPRVVRDLAARCGKKVRIEMEGANTELDKTVLEAIKDPLTHVVRNACDHGIETPEIRAAKGKSPEGLLRLRAYHEGGVVNIEVSDDGSGMDPAKLKSKAIEKGLLRPEEAAQLTPQEAFNLIFLPGFSTAAKVTSISGRGVGMDVVKTNIEKIGGFVNVLNRPEGGTTIRIKIPLTLAIIPGLVITMGKRSDEDTNAALRWLKQERFIIPQVNLLELVRLEKPEELSRIQKVHSTSVFHHRGKLLPLVLLGHVLGRDKVQQMKDVVNIVVLQAENRQLGLVVDSINDTQEIVVKPLGRQLKSLTCYLGATIMGDGRPALILDVAGLARQAGLALQVRQSTQLQSSESSHSLDTQMMLLFRAGKHKRLAVQLDQVNRIEKVAVSTIERAAGKLVLNYRGEILPLVCMAGEQEPLTDAKNCSESVHVVVFRSGAQQFGLVVDEIIDIVNEPVAVKQKALARGVLGSTLLSGKITDLVDLPTLAADAGLKWLENMPALSEMHSELEAA